MNTLLLEHNRKAARARESKETDGWDVKIQSLIDSCHPKQKDFVTDPARRVTALCARGAGKTTGARVRFLVRMMRTPGAECLFIATTRQQAEELMWVELKSTLDRLGIAAKFNETKLVCTLVKSGSRLRLVGADNKREIEKYRGQPFHEVGVDEAASYPPALLENLLHRVIGPRLGDYGGSLFLIGTPGHTLSGPFYDATRPGGENHRPYSERDNPEYEGWIRWSSHQWGLTDGAPHVTYIANLLAEAYVEKNANGWSDEHPVWRREFLGLWAADDTENVFKYRPHLDDGTEWNQWDPERNPATGFAKLPKGDWEYVYGMDMGHSDPFALVIFAYSETEGILRHIYECTKRGMYAKTIAEVLIGPDLDHENLGGCFRITGYPPGIVADKTGFGGATLDELSNVYGIQVKPAEQKNKLDAIELFNGDLVDGRIKILKGSKLEEQMMHLQWVIDDYGKLKERKGDDNHCCDAAIYARREAMHLFRGDEQPDPPPRGSREAIDRRLELEERGEIQHGEFDDLLSSGQYEEEFWG